MRPATASTFAAPSPDGPGAHVEVWHLKDAETRNPIDEARRLRRLVEEWQPGHRASGRRHDPPAVSPNHVAILSPDPDGCPAGPPLPSAASSSFVAALGPGPSARVTVLDSGYIPLNRHLDQRVTLVDGAWYDHTARKWTPDTPDADYLAGAVKSGTLDGITGHGTFIAGLIAHLCPQVELTVVGLRDQELPVGTLTEAHQLGLYASELAIARAMLHHSNADVIQCGFAFPTLDDYPSLAFRRVLEHLEQDRRDVVVVAPAGNESSRHRYWPAALKDATGIPVIGVSATDRRDLHRAEFSNWGDWCTCCTRGAYVYSSFLDFSGLVDGHGTDREEYHGYARWDGTSFAAPRVSALIAAEKLKRAAGTTSAAAYAQLEAAAVNAGHQVSDDTLNPAGVTLPRL